MVNSWINCTKCGHRYGSFVQYCPRCGETNSHYRYPGKRGLGKKIAIDSVIAISVLAVLYVLVSYYLPVGIGSHVPSQSATNNTQSSKPSEHTGSQPKLPIPSIGLPQTPIPSIGLPSNLPQNIQSSPKPTLDELKQYALKKINEDRTKFGLSNVTLSQNNAAQAHANDMLKSLYHSTHWTTDGMKPYMRYTVFNGTGLVAQNVDAGPSYDNETVAKCEDATYICYKVEPYKEIDDAEWQMMNNDSSCCQNGHRDNIFDRWHTDVSIGIAYNDYYFGIVQNFENNYITLNKAIIEKNQDKSTRLIELSGTLSSGNVSAIDVYYDEIPTPAIYELNKDRRSYDSGALIAEVVKPGYYYNTPSNYTLIVASKWDEHPGIVNIEFDLAPILSKQGVYTLYAWVEDSQKPIPNYVLFNFCKE